MTTWFLRLDLGQGLHTTTVTVDAHGASDQEGLSLHVDDGRAVLDLADSWWDRVLPEWSTRVPRLVCHGSGDKLVYFSGRSYLSRVDGMPISQPTLSEAGQPAEKPGNRLRTMLGCAGKHWDGYPKLDYGTISDVKLEVLAADLASFLNRSQATITVPAARRMIELAIRGPVAHEEKAVHRPTAEAVVDRGRLGKDLVPAGLRCPLWEIDERIEQCMACGRFRNEQEPRCAAMADSQDLWRHLGSTNGECPRGQWSITPRPWISLEEATRDTLSVLSSLPEDIVRILAVPRSGLLPGTILATTLHRPLYTIARNRIVPVDPGLRVDGREDTTQGRTLLVDDSIGQGNQWRALLASRLLPMDHYSLVLYATPHITVPVDRIVRTLPVPHLLQWNFFNSCNLRLATLDMDGVICGTPEDWSVYDDGHKELKWFIEAPPLHVPRNTKFPAPAIITARSEKRREVTESWLARHGAQYDRLIMWPETASERSPEAVAQWKVAQVRHVDASFHVEDDAMIVQLMRERHCRVLCIEEALLR